MALKRKSRKGVKEAPGYYDFVQQRFEESVALLEEKGFVMPDGLKDVLGQPDRVVYVNFHAKLAEGLKSFKGFVCLDDMVIKPCKGGTRVTPHVDVETGKALAREMSWKNRLNGLKYGGGKSGIVVDLNQYRGDDAEVIVKAWARSIRDMVGGQYIPAGDIGFGEREADWFDDAYGWGIGASFSNSGAVITGKSPLRRGIEGRRGATGRGLAFAVDAAAEHLGWNLEEKIAVVQGLGKVGLEFAKQLVRRGVKVIGLGAIGGCVYNENGLRPDDVAEYEHSHGGSFEGYSHGKLITQAELLELECDILGPCAIENVITVENAHKIKAELIVEGANGPTTPEANGILGERGIQQLTGIYANSGGVRVSEMEDNQARMGRKYTLEEVDRELEAGMRKTFREIVAASNDWQVDWTTAAYMLAIKRQAEYHMAGGFRP
ncbi:MAG: Glu/Leu/Phe/Val dehydrogenase [Methanobacteriota archaeon]